MSFLPTSKNTFDSVELNAVLRALAYKGNDGDYAKAVKKINQSSSYTHRRGREEGLPFFPKLFAAFLEMLYHKLIWK